MKSVRVASILLLLLGVSPMSALAIGKGTGLVAVELTSGTANIAATSVDDAGYISAFEIPEFGVRGQFWYMLAEDYAVTVGGGAGFSHETNEPGQGTIVNAPDITRKSTSFNVRLGGDRVVKVADRALMYGGPGIELWVGKAKVEDGTTYETENTTRIALSARIGATILFNDTVGLHAQVGHHIGRASAEENDAKATWWPSGFDGSMGIMFLFGSD